MEEPLIFNWTTILSFSNLILSSAIVIIAFSLLTYILSHNLTSSVARAFCVLLASVMVVYAGDVLVALTDSQDSAITWLRFQWIGIAVLPAAYLHFGEAVQHTTGVRITQKTRRILLGGAYFLSVVFLFLAIVTDTLVRDGQQMQGVVHLLAGPAFWTFATYFAAAVVLGGAGILRARRRCLTPTSLRRMTYLMVAFIAPAFGVFPYLLVASSYGQTPPLLVLSLATAGNVVVALMVILMGYSVAYYGVLSPDRIVKRSLLHFLLRGPFVGICVIVAVLTIPRVERVLGLPRDTVLIFATMALVVLLQLLIDLFEPLVDRLVYRQDQEEIAWLHELDRRLLTTTDLMQFLENLLTAMCELLRVRTGFIADVANGEWRLEAQTGDDAAIQACLLGVNVGDMYRAPAPASVKFLGPSRIEFRRDDGFWLLPLRTRTQDATLGLLGLKLDALSVDLSDAAGEAVEALIAQAEIALEDRHLQQGVFSTLLKIIPEIDRIQRWRSTVRYTTRETLEMLDDSPVSAPEYQLWVKEALTHYWGGPKLSNSPLLKLRVVARKLQEEGNSVNALRAVLTEAIEALRPEGQRHMTTSEWLLYNILEMRYIQGRRVRDIADSLAMSESDLYRKQRVALDEVAKTLAQMEQQKRS